MISRVFIIYNPNSTGSGKDNATTLRDELAASSHPPEVTLIPTQHAGHARELARSYASPDTMVISSSGDGGYHEVINGIVESDHPTTVAGLLPSGNANDHYHSEHSGNIIQRIIDGDTRTVSLLKIEWNDETIYAHSYAGIGFTADIGHALTAASLTPLREAWIVIKGLLLRRSVRVIIDRQPQRFDSLIYAVSTRMSKYIKTGAEQANDHEFAVIKTPHRSFGWLLRHLLRRVQPPSDPTTATEATFQTTRRTLLQCDGEVLTIPARATVQITVWHGLHEII